MATRSSAGAPDASLAPRSGSILVVEDDPDHLKKIACEILRGRGVSRRGRRQWRRGAGATAARSASGPRLDRPDDAGDGWVAARRRAEGSAAAGRDPGGGDVGARDPRALVGAGLGGVRRQARASVGPPPDGRGLPGEERQEQSGTRPIGG